MGEASLLEAWGRWFDGEQVAELRLWGLEILWWGRIGKVIGLVAGSVIIAEIIGVARLRRAGVWLRARRDADVSDQLGRVAGLMIAGVMGSPRRVAALLVLYVVILAADRFVADVPDGLVLATTAFAASPILVMVVLAPSLFVAAVAFALVDRLVVAPLTWVFERPRPDTALKVGSVIVLLVGFHFDLLAS